MRDGAGKQKSLAVEATVFWLVVSGVITASLAAGIYVDVPGFLGPPYFIITVSLTALHFGLAYASWSMRRWAFTASIIYGLAVAGAFSGIIDTSIGALLILLQLQIVFFAYRAYKENKQGLIPISPLRQ